ncbi:hypothetical protein [Streptomyces sp. NPDC006691]|uniref:hypothetical protein n=1 Tax=Streptomyces sp. NPDC006691 TaxID=3364757 RepID=UPI0036A8F2F8
MTREEFRRTPTEAEVRAAFVAVVGGAAAEPGQALARAATEPALAGVPTEGAALDPFLTALAARASAGRGPGAPWGMDLVTGELRRVPARALPVSDGRPGLPPVGAAAGFTWLGAVEEGLAQQCEWLIAERLATDGVRAPRLDLRPDCAGACHPAECVACAVAPLRALGSPVVHDLSELLSLPACALRTAAGAATFIAVAGGRASAVHRAVGRAMSGSFRTMPAIRPDQECPSHAVRPAGVQWTRPFDALRAGGWSPAAVLLHHDSRMVAVLPYLVQVVLPGPAGLRPAQQAS